MPDTTHIALQWLSAFNAHNLEELLALYSNAAVHFSPKLKIRQPATGGFIKGKDALRKWWRDALDRLPTLHYKLVSLTGNGERIFMEYIRQVAGEQDMRVAEVLEIENQLIVASRVYHG